MNVVKWFNIEAQSPELDDPYPSEQWSLKVVNDDGDVFFCNTIEEALERLKKKGFIE